jgi:rare lipoprotein A
VNNTARGVRSAGLAMLLLLAACSGPAPRPGDSTPSAGETASLPATAPTSAPKRPPPTPRGGAYYKDDGPGDDIPDNLDSIADAQPRSETLHRFANKPYVVLGRLYVPNTSVKPFQQRGVASWYGKKFHGQKTSIGEPYDMFAMTAAHPTLAIPSYVRVTNVGNGNSVVVRVTDRGPFHADRIIDLSYAAAYRLGYVNNGSTPVEVEAIVPGETRAQAYAQAKAPAKAAAPDAEPDEIEALVAKLVLNDTAPAAAKPAMPLAAGPRNGIFLQLGAFSNAENAESLRAHLSRELSWLNEAIQITAAAGLFRVQLGPYTQRAEAESVAEKIRAALGYKPAFVNR